MTEPPSYPFNVFYFLRERGREGGSERERLRERERERERDCEWAKGREERETENRK